MSVEFFPTEDRLLVKRDEEQGEKRTTSGLLIVPDVAKQKSQRGTILRVGPGRLTEDGQTVKMRFDPGVRVVFGKYSGAEIEDGDTVYLVMREADILAVITGEEKPDA